MINPEAKLKQYINNMQTRLGVFSFQDITDRGHTLQLPLRLKTEPTHL